MKRLFKYIQQRLELRIGLLIVLIITVVFIMLFDFLFYRCKQYVQHAAIDRAVQLLDNTVEHINGIMVSSAAVPLPRTRSLRVWPFRWNLITSPKWAATIRHTR